MLAMAVICLMHWPDLKFPPVNLYTMPAAVPIEPMFLEERLPVALKLGANYSDGYGVERATDPRTGRSYSRLRVANPARELVGSYIQATETMWAGVIDLYHRSFGGHAGFRVKFLDDFSTKNHIGIPTALDQPLEYVESGVYQLQKQYGAGGTPLSIGLPVRTLKKPVAGTVLIAVDGIATTAFSVDPATGLVTLDTPPAGDAVVTGGCYFDIPCTFAEKFDINTIAFGYRETGQIRLVELLNP
jgi:uncharacterized protein (TIGR02217 family)